MINAALGFDTFLVLRHGLRKTSALEQVPSDVNICASSSGASAERIKKVDGSMLGCYFCNDVVAPGDVCVS